MLNKMTNTRQIKKIPREQVRTAEQTAPHRLYYAFVNTRSAALELARVIRDDCGSNLSKDVQRFLDECEKKC
jgi:hypothetical protein